MIRKRKIIRVNEKEKQVVRKRIDYLMDITNENNWNELKNIFGRGIAEGIDSIISSCRYQVFINRWFDITYLDVYKELEKEMNLVFDVSYENITDCFISDYGSFFERCDEDKIEITWEY